MTKKAVKCVTCTFYISFKTKNIRTFFYINDYLYPKFHDKISPSLGMPLYEKIAFAYSTPSASRRNLALLIIRSVHSIDMQKIRSTA